MNVRIYENHGRWFYACVKEDGSFEEKLCSNCFTRREAEVYVRNIAGMSSSYLIKNLTKDMYVMNGRHLDRLAQFGKQLCEKTVLDRRFYIKVITKDFGDYDLRCLSVKDIEYRLLIDRVHSGSWKNNYLETFQTIYDESVFKCSIPVPRPRFQRFARNSKKANVFTGEELSEFFKSSNWISYDMYVMFFLSYSCGLRLGEARGLRVSQFLFSEKVLVVNGFCKEDGTRTNYNKKGNEEDGKIRVVPIPDKSLAVAIDYIKSKKIEKDDFLFVREGKPVKPDTARRVFYKALKKSGIEKTKERKLVPHSLRYTYVTRMRLSLGVEEVKKIVGHSDVSMTEYYTRFGLKELIEGVKDSFSATEKLFE